MTKIRHWLGPFWPIAIFSVIALIALSASRAGLGLWQQERVDAVAQGLIDAGVAPGDRVGIFLGNRPEWSEIDFGAGAARAVPVPLYATSTPEQIAFIGRDSGLSVMFVGGKSEAERVLEAAEALGVGEGVSVRLVAV